ncbi:MAG: zinc-dependent metalloprotease [Promicromonosporaceae bacterium]|nr:zinc-dependent metalloprotease [Promicromonosporaceae bacterium]
MSDPANANHPEDRERQVRELLSSMFGERVDEVMAQMRSAGVDPASMLGDGPLPTTLQMQAAMRQFQQIMVGAGEGPVNAQLAENVARQTAVMGGDPAVTGAQDKEVAEAMSIAELWLDAVTNYLPCDGPARAWSRSQWVEATLPAWHALVAPVAASMSEAMASVLAGEDRDGESSLADGDPLKDIEAGLLQSGDLEGFKRLNEDLASPSSVGSPSLPGMDLLGLGNLSPVGLMRRLGAAAFGMQVGQAAGNLSREVFGTTDLGLPLLESPGTALLPANIAAFARGLDTPLPEVRLYLAVREAAHARLFTHVPWLRRHLLSLVEQYASGIDINHEALGDQMRGVDSSDPSALHRALSGGGLFNLTQTPQQQATLLRLETALALVEGWVDEVSAQAALPHLPNSVPLREMLRRRRASGGPAERTFANLVGLELRPRRSRDAATLFTHVYISGGVEARDAVWSHPDLLPEPADLDDPAGYLARREARRLADTEIDQALERLLSGDA